MAKNNSYGCNLNLSMAINPGEDSEVAIKFEDSDGAKIDRHASGKDPYNLLNTLADGITKELTDKNKKDDAKIKQEKAERDKKRADLNKQMKDIQDQLNALDKKDNEVSNKHHYDLFDDEDYFSELKDEYEKALKNILRNW